jgi:hypothetical protein
MPDPNSLLKQKGISVNFQLCPFPFLSLSEKIREYVTQTRLRYPWNKPDIPLAVLILACIKHRSPLPPEFWRGTIFPADDQAG